MEELRGSIKLSASQTLPRAAENGSSAGHPGPDLSRLHALCGALGSSSSADAQEKAMDGLLEYLARQAGGFFDPPMGYPLPTPEHVPHEVFRILREELGAFFGFSGPSTTADEAALKSIIARSKVIPAFISALQNGKSQGVRTKAAVALAAVGSKSTELAELMLASNFLSALKKLLRDGNVNDALCALNCMSALAPQPIAQSFVEDSFIPDLIFSRFMNDGGAVRICAINAMITMSDLVKIERIEKSGMLVRLLNMLATGTLDERGSVLSLFVSWGTKDPKRLHLLARVDGFPLVLESFGVEDDAIRQLCAQVLKLGIKENATDVEDVLRSIGQQLITTREPGVEAFLRVLLEVASQTGGAKKIAQHNLMRFVFTELGNPDSGISAIAAQVVYQLYLHPEMQRRIVWGLAKMTKVRNSAYRLGGARGINFLAKTKESERVGLKKLKLAPLLQKMLKDQLDEIRVLAVEAIWYLTNILGLDETVNLFYVGLESASRYVKNEVCDRLALASTHPDARRKLVERGFLPLLLEELRSPPLDGALLQTLENIGVDPRFTVQITKTLCTMMTPPEVRINGCVILLIQLALRGRAVSAAMVKAGVLPSVLRHLRDECNLVRRHVSKVLLLLADVSCSHEELMKCSTVRTIKAALADENVEDVQENLVVFLTRLASSTKFKRLLIREGLIQVLMHFIEQDDVGVREAAICLLMSMAFDEQIRPDLSKVPELVSKLQVFVKRPSRYGFRIAEDLLERLLSEPKRTRKNSIAGRGALEANERENFMSFIRGQDDWAAKIMNAKVARKYKLQAFLEGIRLDTANSVLRDLKKEAKAVCGRGRTKSLQVYPVDDYLMDASEVTAACAKLRTAKRLSVPERQHLFARSDWLQYYDDDNCSSLLPSQRCVDFYQRSIRVKSMKHNDEILNFICPKEVSDWQPLLAGKMVIYFEVTIVSMGPEPEPLDETLESNDGQNGRATFAQASLTPETRQVVGNGTTSQQEEEEDADEVDDDECDDRCVSIGFCDGDYSESAHVGFEPVSVGYVSDAGSITVNSDDIVFGEEFGEGDVVGAGLDLNTGVVFFTKNGCLQPMDDMPEFLCCGNFFPCVALEGGPEIIVNGGARPFVFDITSHIETIESYHYASDSEEDSLHRRRDSQQGPAEVKGSQEGFADDEDDWVDDDGYDEDEYEEDDEEEEEYICDCCRRRNGLPPGEDEEDEEGVVRVPSCQPHPSKWDANCWDAFCIVSNFKALDVHGVVPLKLEQFLALELGTLADAKEKDFKPGASRGVQNLIDPSLYPYIDGITLPTDQEVVLTKRLRRDHLCRWNLDDSSRYQWLPSDIAIDKAGQAQFLSYINNLDEDLHPGLCRAMHHLFTMFVPLFEDVLGKDLKGQTVQAVVRAEAFLVEPGRKFDGQWTIEGLPHEHIIACGMYVVSSSPWLVDQGIAFRRERYTNDYPRGPSDIFDHDPEIQAWENNIFLGTVPTPPGTMVAFENRAQHRFVGIRNTGTATGKHTVLMFLLVSPDRKIISTADVVPQQREITLRKLLVLLDEIFRQRFHKELPVDILTQICEYAVPEALIFVDAELHRLEDMRGRHQALAYMSKEWESTYEAYDEEEAFPY